MGQRMQYIIKYPRYFLNEDNPNNYDAGLIIIHNQWSYGLGALNRLTKYLESINKFIENSDDETHYSEEIDWRNALENTVNHINYSDVTSVERNHIDYDTYNDEHKLWLKQKGCMLNLLEGLDNNNGFMFINIKEDKTVEYSIMNGYEDAEELLDRTPEEYAKLFDTEDTYGILDKLKTPIWREVSEFERTYDDLVKSFPSELDLQLKTPVIVEQYTWERLDKKTKIELLMLSKMEGSDITYQMRKHLSEEIYEEYLRE